MTDAIAIAIVGASLAGIRCAAALRRGGFDDRIVLIGAEPQRPYDRPPLSKDFISGKLAGARELETDALYGSIDLRLGVRADRLDRACGRVELSDGTSVTANHVVIATGSRALVPPSAQELDGVFVLRTIDDARALREALSDATSLVIVGAGPTGTELAASASELGVRVALVCSSPALTVGRGGPEIGAVLHEEHRGRGVDVRLGARMAALRGAGRVTGVELEDGSVLDADLVVLAIGAAPETDWLDGSGIAVDDGVVTDELLAADGGGGHVWAAGDVARWRSGTGTQRMAHWTNASDQGTLVARNILGARVPYRPIPYMWSDQYGTRIQVLGRNDGPERRRYGTGDDQRFAIVSATASGVVVGGATWGWPTASGLIRRAMMASTPLDLLDVELSEQLEPKPVATLGRI